MGMYQGVNASEGIGIGTVMVAVDPDLTFEPHEVADSAAEKERYQSALSVFCEKTQAQADHMKETVGEAEAEAARAQPLAALQNQQLHCQCPPKPWTAT